MDGLIVHLNQVVSCIATMAAEAAAASEKTKGVTAIGNCNDSCRSNSYDKTGASTTTMATAMMTTSSSWKPITKIKLMQTFQPISLHCMLHVLLEFHAYHMVEHLASIGIPLDEVYATKLVQSCCSVHNCKHCTCVNYYPKAWRCCVVIIMAVLQVASSCSSIHCSTCMNYMSPFFTMSRPNKHNGLLACLNMLWSCNV